MIEAQDITPHNFGSTKKQFIKKIIVDIYNELPDTKEYKSALVPVLLLVVFLLVPMLLLVVFLLL